MREKVWGIVVAAGRGERFRPTPTSKESLRLNSALPKQFQPLRNKPLYVHSLKRLSALSEIEAFIVVALREFIPRVEAEVNKFRLKKVKKVIAGGRERQDSVWAGLKSVPEETELVMVHDAVRPFPPLEETRAAIRLAKERGSAILAVPATDTVKITGERGKSAVKKYPKIEQTVERGWVWLAQTPQVFRYSWLMEAYHYIINNSIKITDEAQALELIGKPVYIVPGSEENIKITTPQDMKIAEWLITKL